MVYPPSEKHERMSVPHEEALADAGPTVKDDDERGGAGEAAGLLEIEAQLQVNPEIAAAKELDVSLLLSPVGRLEAWTALLPHATSELLEELGGGYLFLVSGDALLLHLLRKQHLDADVKRGFQPLRLLYQAERLLQQIEAAGGHFKLVFFRAFSAASGAHPLFCLMQQLLQLHLFKQGVEFLSLPNWWGPEFAGAIAALHPLFMLIDDVYLPDLSEEVYEAEEDMETDSESDAETEAGTTGALRDPRDVLRKAGKSWELPDSVSLDVCQMQADALRKIKQRGARCTSLLLQSLCLSCCRLGVDLAFMQGLVIKPTKVFAPSASCYAGANIWRAMESRLSGSSSSSSSGETGAAAGDKSQHCPLQRALEQHSNMLQDIDVVPPPLDEEKVEEGESLLQQLQELAQQKKQKTAPLRYFMVESFCRFLRTAAAAEDADEDEQQQLQQFVAVGKLLMLVAALQQELSLPERCHGYRPCCRNSEFVRDFLYAPLRLYCAQMHGVLTRANDFLLLLQQQQKGGQQQQKGQQLLQLLDGKELADLFDGKLLVSLIGLAAAAARSNSNWGVSASSVGLSAERIEEIESIWKRCSGGPQQGPLSGPFFPISLESLRDLLEGPSSLPVPRLPPAAEEQEEQKQQQQQSAVDLLALSSTFLQRLRAGAPPKGALPDVKIAEDAEEMDLAERHTKKQLLVQRELLVQQESDSESEETKEGQTTTSDSEDEANVNEKDAQRLQQVLELRAVVHEKRMHHLQATFRDAPAEASCSRNLRVHLKTAPILRNRQKRNVLY